MIPNEGVQNELMQRLLEQAGLAEEGEGFDNSFSAYSQGKVPDVGVGFMLEVPKSYWKEKAGVFYKDYGDMGENWYQNSMDELGGLGDLSIHFFK